ncbi:hypothetical protein LEP1GSC060_1426 [Leptospira weilii serovar Ranarum str. ICFT]|uniref:Uncharacterized protein n=1 Tax=Leptospira weilii serovar Ranarum str. ICFT TaxID=1218598 RepID=N1WRD0_9LEPT|nr:hypothetical protein LEP1GSC060_1426 [Leptospira weilii serovar Ranarum str. ICFT]
MKVASVKFSKMEELRMKVKKSGVFSVSIFVRNRYRKNVTIFWKPLSWFTLA